MGMYKIDLLDRGKYVDRVNLPGIPRAGDYVKLGDSEYKVYFTIYRHGCETVSLSCKRIMYKQKGA